MMGIMRIDILTTLPDPLRQALNVTVMRRIKGEASLHIHDLHTYAEGHHKQIRESEGQSNSSILT